MVHVHVHVHLPSRQDNFMGNQSLSQTSKECLLSQTISQLFHGPAPRSPLRRLSLRTAPPLPVEHKCTEYSLPGASLNLSNIASEVFLSSFSPSVQGDPCRFLPRCCTARAGFLYVRHSGGGPLESSIFQ